MNMFPSSPWRFANSFVHSWLVVSMVQPSPKSFAVVAFGQLTLSRKQQAVAAGAAAAAAAAAAAVAAAFTWQHIHIIHIILSRLAQGNSLSKDMAVRKSEGSRQVCLRTNYHKSSVSFLKGFMCGKDWSKFKAELSQAPQAHSDVTTHCLMRASMLQTKSPPACTFDM